MPFRCRQHFFLAWIRKTDDTTITLSGSRCGSVQTCLPAAMSCSCSPLYSVGCVAFSHGRICGTWAIHRLCIFYNTYCWCFPKNAIRIPLYFGGTSPKQSYVLSLCLLLRSWFTPPLLDILSSFFLKEHFVENVAGVQENIYKQPNHTVLPPFFYIIP